MRIGFLGGFPLCGYQTFASSLRILYLSTGICNSSLKFGIERIIYMGIAPVVKYEIGPFSPLSIFEALIRRIEESVARLILSW